MQKNRDSVLYSYTIPGLISIARRAKITAKAYKKRRPDDAADCLRLARTAQNFIGLNGVDGAALVFVVERRQWLYLLADGKFALRTFGLVVDPVFKFVVDGVGP